MNMNLSDDLLKKIFWSLLAAIFVLMVFYTPQYGINGDDVSQHNYGKSVWAYLSTFGSDKTAVTGKLLENTQTLYGGFFDGFSSMMISVLHPKDEFLFRHYWVMVFGFLGFLVTGLFAKDLGGWRAGVLSLILLFFVPRFFGDAMNNPKDIPFATSYILGIHAIWLWLRNIDQLKWKNTIYLGLSIALCLSIRIGGLLLVAYLGLFFAIVMWQKKLFKEKTFSASIKHLATAGVIGYFGAILWWPYALESPFSHPMEAFKMMSNYPIHIKMIFEGHRIDTGDLPWYYLPKWLFIAHPLYLLAGVICGTATIVLIERKFKNSAVWMVLFSALFPIFFIVYNKSTLYDGLRHTLFTVPPMIIICTLFFIYVFDVLKNKGMRFAFAGVLIILIALPAKFMFANHPNEYVYFNEIAGGIKSAYGVYETDYYMNSIMQGYKWLLENELSKSKESAIVASNCAEPLVEYAKVSPIPFRPMYSRFYQKNQKEWDYAIYYGRFLDREQLQHGYFPSSMAIHVVKADGVPLCTVLKNDPERNGFKGYTAMQQNDLPKALEYFNKAVAKYPDDLEIWNYMALIYRSMGNLPDAQRAIDKAMAISSIDIQTANIAGEIAMQAGDFNKASKIYGDLIDENSETAEAYLGLGKAQAGLGNFAMAIDNVKHAIEMEPQLTPQGYMALAYIYNKKGDQATAQKYYNAAKSGGGGQ